MQCALEKNDAEILSITLTTSTIRTQTLCSHSYNNFVPFTQEANVIVEDSGKSAATKQKY